MIRYLPDTIEYLERDFCEAFCRDSLSLSNEDTFIAPLIDELDGMTLCIRILLVEIDLEDRTTHRSYDIITVETLVEIRILSDVRDDIGPGLTIFERKVDPYAGQVTARFAFVNRQ